MDKKKFNEIVNEYMLFDKRTLAEILAFRDTKNIKENDMYSKMVSAYDTEQAKATEYVTRRYCAGMNEYCYCESCEGCLFNQANKTNENNGETFTLDKNYFTTVSFSGTDSQDFTKSYTHSKEDI